MNLNHSPFDRRRPLSRLPRDIAALAAAAAGEGEGGGTIPVEPQATAGAAPGAFNGSMAAALTRWKDE